MAESLANLLIGLGATLVAVMTLLQSFGVYLLSGETELQAIQTLMKEGKTQGEADKIVKDRNSRTTRVYAGLIFLGAVTMAVGGLYK